MNPLSTGSKQRANCTVTIGFTARQYLALRDAGAAFGLSFAEVVRRLVEDWLVENPEWAPADVEAIPALAAQTRAAADRQTAHRRRLEFFQKNVEGRAPSSSPEEDATHVPNWPSSIEFRIQPPVGGITIPWNEVAVWNKEAGRRAKQDPTLFSAPPKFQERPLGTPVDEWQASLRMALGLSPQPEDVKDTEAV